MAFRAFLSGYYWLGEEVVGRAFHERDGIADPVQALGEFVGGTFGVKAVKVIASPLVINASIANEGIHDREQAMRHRHGRLLHSAPLRNPPEQRGQKAVPCVRGGPGALYQ